VRRGYVVLIPDSFGTRGFADGVCRDPSPARASVGPVRRAGDAYAALAHLRTLPYVDGRTHRRHGRLSRRIHHSRHDGEAGLCRGGGALSLMRVDRWGGWNGRAGTGAYRPAAPLLILIGEKDDWTPAEPCRKMAEASERAGHPVSIKVYPGAHHSFDSSAPLRYVAARVNLSSPTGRGATHRRKSGGLGGRDPRGRRLLRPASRENRKTSLESERQPP